MTKKKKYLIWATTIFVIFPLLIDQWFAAKERRYESLRAKYECYPPPCSFDLTGDNVPEKLVVHQPDPTKRFEWVLLLKDGDKELLRLPYDHTDGTFRTHMAVRSGPQGTHFLIYDVASRNGQGRAVYGWNGNQVVALSPDPLDEEILTAMAALDETGTFHWWVLFHMVRTAFYALLILGILVTGIINFSKRH